MQAHCVPMPLPRAIPAELRTGPFLTSSALRLGLTYRELRSGRFRRIFRDVYVVAAVPDSLELRCSAALLIMPAGAVFCGVTAARLYGLPVPADDQRIHAAVPRKSTGTVPRLIGIVVHRVTLDSAEFRKPHGLWTIGPERLYIELAAVLTRLDLIIAGDQLLSAGWTDLPGLAGYLGRTRNLRGLRLGRRTMSHLEPRADSPPESRLRMLIVDNGFPRPVANADVFDRSGDWIARPDLAYPNLKIAIEYEGRHHQEDPAQYDRDIHRNRDLRSDGWIVNPYHARILFQTPTMILDDLADAFTERGVSAPPRHWRSPMRRVSGC
jgi:hypothetical protein